VKISECPVAGCTSSLLEVSFGKGRRPWCAQHGIRLHSDTFVYWNGRGMEDESRLRNFIVRPDLVRVIALPKGMKAESHRLGYEMSEDALSWNVFVSLAEAGKLRDAAEFLTGRSVRTEPGLYLWGRHIDLSAGGYAPYEPLHRVRAALEPDINTFVTEPDIMLVAPGEIVICIEAKFGSANPLSDDRDVGAGEKPISRAGLLRRYLGSSTSKYTKGIVQQETIGQKLRSQLFRNVVFASEMAQEIPWHVVNLVSRTQGRGRDDARKSYADPTDEVRGYLHPNWKHCFTYRSWEDLHTTLIKDESSLDALDIYLRAKSAHYRPAFDLSHAGR
jgi:hypothetical protein